MAMNNTQTLVGGGNSTIKKERSSNLELYRIIVMFLIVCHHYVINDGLGNVASSEFTPNSLFYNLFGMWGKTGINCFVMITGYFMCSSTITLRKFIKLYLQVLFYAVVLYVIFWLTGYYSFSVKDLFLKCLPFRNVVSNSFVNAFIVWWLFIPFLNAMVNNITAKQHGNLILLTVTLFTVYPILPICEIAVNPICWFSTLYFISSYIRKYPEKIYKAYSGKTWGGLTLVSVITSMLSVVAILLINQSYGKAIGIYGFVADSHKPLALLVAVCSFMFFKNIRMGYSRLINMAGGATFGVLLIHANSNAMRQWLWYDTIDCVGHYSMPGSWAYAIGCCMAVFIICAVIDIIRLSVFEKPLFQWLDLKIFNRK